MLWMEVRTEAGFMFISWFLIPIQMHVLLLLISYLNAVFCILEFLDVEF